MSLAAAVCGDDAKVAVSEIYHLARRAQHVVYAKRRMMTSRMRHARVGVWKGR
jgi:hypothetical protein